MEYHMRHEPYTSVVVPNFPPEGTAPPVDMTDLEFNPYLKAGECNGNAMCASGAAV